LPEGFELEYLVYSLCGDDPSRERYILENWTMADVSRYFAFKDYDRFNLERQMKR